MSNERLLGRDKLLLTVEEASERLGLGKTKVYQLLARNELGSIRIGAARRIPVSSLEAYVERLLREQACDLA